MPKSRVPTASPSPSRRGARNTRPAATTATVAAPGLADAAESRLDAGAALRRRVPRTSHGAFALREGRDPLAILEAQEHDRLQHLVPLRHARMAESAFAYYRGTPAVMAFDLVGTARTDIIVQAGGDAHLGNFGLFASPERQLVFDANDFDETLPAPWEWDVKRLAASVVIAGRGNGFRASANRTATMAAVRGYREWMARFAELPVLAVWYANIGADEIRRIGKREFADHPDLAHKRSVLNALFAKARSRDQARAARALTRIEDGHRVLIEEPPLIQHMDIPGGREAVLTAFAAYRETLPDDRKALLGRYRFADMALKVVGVGSVATRCFVALLLGRDEDDPLMLQIKEATASVLEGPAMPSLYPHHGQRVVAGQRLMQATSDIFLGWVRGPEGRDFYVRQLWDMKGSIETSTLRPEGLAFYGSVCGWSLARSHARSGHAAEIAAYLGMSDRFDGAVADFAETYADQNERDFEAFRAAIADGRVASA